MAANGTNQSMLMGHTRSTYNNSLSNSRAQAYGRASSPNTPYNNQGANTMYSNSFQPSYYQPTGYSGQDPNLGRYVPPMMEYGNPNNWMNSGGYHYNVPQAYTGGYSGFPPQIMNSGNSPFMSFLSNMMGQGNFGGQWGGNQASNSNIGTDFTSFLNSIFGNQGQTNVPARSNVDPSYWRNNPRPDGFGTVPGQMDNYRKPMQIGGAVTQTSSAPFRGLPTGFGG